jgi:hypothetical protein
MQFVAKNSFLDEFTWLGSKLLLAYYTVSRYQRLFLSSVTPVSF